MKVRSGFVSREIAPPRLGRNIGQLFFFDSEFTDLKLDADLISVSFIAADGRSFYAIFTDFDPAKMNEFVWRNVVPKLRIPEKPDKKQTFILGDTAAIKEALLAWLWQFEWSDAGEKYDLSRRRRLIVKRPTYDWPFLEKLLGKLNPWQYYHLTDFDSFLEGKTGAGVKMPKNRLAHNSLADTDDCRKKFLSLTK